MPRCSSRIPLHGIAIRESQLAGQARRAASARRAGGARVMVVPVNGRGFVLARRLLRELWRDSIQRSAGSAQPMDCGVQTQDDKLTARYRTGEPALDL